MILLFLQILELQELISPDRQSKKHPGVACAPIFDLSPSVPQSLPAVPDVHHVAILHNVFLAFKAQYASGARRGL